MRALAILVLATMLCGCETARPTPLAVAHPELIREKIQIAERMVAIHQQAVADTRSGFAAGRSSFFDLLVAQNDLSHTRDRVFEYQKELARAEGRSDEQLAALIEEQIGAVAISSYGQSAQNPDGLTLDEALVTQRELYESGRVSSRDYLAEARRMLEHELRVVELRQELAQVRGAQE